MSDMVDRLRAYARLREFSWLVHVIGELEQLRKEVAELRRQADTGI